MGVLWISCDRDDRRIFLGLKFPISGFFWLGKFGQVFFWVDLSTDFLGYSKLMFLFFRVISFNAFWKCLRLGNSAWDFLGLNFGSGTIWGFCLKPKGVFRVMIFAPIRLSPSLEIRIRPPPPPSLGQKVTNFSTHTSALSHWPRLR